MKKIVFGILIGILLSACTVTFAAEITKYTALKTSYTVQYNGNKLSLTNPVVSISGIHYVPIKELCAGMSLKYSLDTKASNIILGEASTPSNASPTLPISSTVDKVTVALTKVSQDEDSLKIYFTYTNNSNDMEMPLPSLTKVVCNGKQYGYNSRFNFERYYETGVDHFDESMEPGVTAKTIVFFEPIPGADVVNIVANVNFNSIRFNNIKVN